MLSWSPTPPGAAWAWPRRRRGCLPKATSSVLSRQRFLQFQIIVVHRHVPEIQTAFVRYIGRVPGVVGPLAVHQYSVPVSPGSYRQTARYLLIAASEALVSGNKGHVLQQIVGKMAKLLRRQLDHFDDFHPDGLHRFFFHQILSMTGLIEKVAIDNRLGQCLTSLQVSTRHLCSNKISELGRKTAAKVSCSHLATALANPAAGPFDAEDERGWQNRDCSTPKKEHPATASSHPHPAHRHTLCQNRSPERHEPG